MNKLFGAVAGLLFVVGITSATPVAISSYTWDGDMATNSLAAIMANNGLTDYSQVDIETFLGQFADCMVIEEIASNKDINSFGFYEVGNIAAKTEIFPGPASAGAHVVVALPATDIGFYLNPKDNALNGTDIFYSQSSLNSGIGQVAVFQSNTSPKDFVLGWEDLSMKNGASSTYGELVSDGDFNDFVVKVSVPEPMTLSFLGLSLLSLSGISLIRRKRK